MNFIEDKRNMILNNSSNLSEADMIEIEMESHFITSDYINELLYDNFEYVEEGVIDSVKDKSSTLINKLKEIWKKFKAWITNLVRVVTNLFRSGESMVKKYGRQIREEYNKKKNVITFNSYIYRLNSAALSSLSIKIISSNFITKYSNKSQEEFNEMMAIEFIRDKHKTDHNLSDVPVDVIIDFLSNSKSVIKNIKQTEKNIDKSFNNAINKVKSNGDVNQEEVNQAKDGTKMATRGLNALIKEIRDGVKLYTSLVRKLLDNRIKGEDGTDTENDKNNNSDNKIDFNKASDDANNEADEKEKQKIDELKNKFPNASESDIKSVAVAYSEYVYWESLYKETNLDKYKKQMNKFNERYQNLLKDLENDNKGKNDNGRLSPQEYNDLYAKYQEIYRKEKDEAKEKIKQETERMKNEYERKYKGKIDIHRIEFDIHNVAEDKIMLEIDKKLANTELCKKSKEFKKTVDENIKTRENMYNKSLKQLQNQVNIYIKDDDDNKSELETHINEYAKTQSDKMKGKQDNSDSEKKNKLREQYRQELMKASDDASDKIDKEYEKLSKQYDLKDKQLNRQLMELKIDVATHTVYLNDVYNSVKNHENLKYDDMAKNTLERNIEETTSKLKKSKEELEKKYKELSKSDNKSFDSKKYTENAKSNMENKKNENKLTQARLKEDTWDYKDHEEWGEFLEKMEETEEELKEKYYKEIMAKVPKEKGTWASTFALFAAKRDIVEKTLNNPLLDTNPKMREKYLKKQEKYENEFKKFAQQARQYRDEKSSQDTNLKEKVSSNVDKTINQMVIKIRQDIKNEFHEISDKNKGSFNILAEFKKNANTVNKKVTDEYNDYLHDKYGTDVVSVASLVNTISLYTMGGLTLHHKGTPNNIKREGMDLHDTFEPKEALAIDLIKKQLISEIIKKRS